MLRHGFGVVAFMCILRMRRCWRFAGVSASRLLRLAVKGRLETIGTTKIVLGQNCENHRNHRARLENKELRTHHEHLTDVERRTKERYETLRKTRPQRDYIVEKIRQEEIPQ